MEACNLCYAGLHEYKGHRLTGNGNAKVDVATRFTTQRDGSACFRRTYKAKFAFLDKFSKTWHTLFIQRTLIAAWSGKRIECSEIITFTYFLFFCEDLFVNGNAVWQFWKLLMTYSRKLQQLMVQHVWTDHRLNSYAKQIGDSISP